MKYSAEDGTLKIFLKLFVTDESEVEETISLARSVLTEGKMVLIKSVSKFGVHAQVVGQIRKKVTTPKFKIDLESSTWKVSGKPLKPLV